MNPKAIIPGARTDGDDAAFRYPAVPVTSEQIIMACLEARAPQTLALLGSDVASPDEARQMLKLERRP